MDSSKVTKEFAGRVYLGSLCLICGMRVRKSINKCLVTWHGATVAFFTADLLRINVCLAVKLRDQVWHSSGMGCKRPS